MVAIINIEQREFERRYYPLSYFNGLSDFVQFIVWIACNKKFSERIKLEIGEHEFEISVFPEMSGRGWMAVEDGMFGGEPGSIYSYHSMISREDALEGLIEKLKENL